MDSIDRFDIGPQNIPDRNVFRKSIYDNSANELGLLTEHESSAVIYFYGSMENIQGQIQEFTNAQR